MFETLWEILSPSDIPVSAKIVALLITLLMIGICVLYFMFRKKAKEVKFLRKSLNQ